ncbi:MAG: ABC transporter permease [Acidobacteriia bacterium]|nr:ABC transporter permease [Terriglobia bacterium]
MIVRSWPESWIADAVFGWRQLLKHKAVSGAAILSLAVGIGSCLSAFRLIDALFLRPLPIAHPEHLYALTYEALFESKIDSVDQFDYPAFLRLRRAVRGEAQLMAVAFPGRIDLTFGSDQEIEPAYRQYVSGSMFDSFGLQATLGRLLTGRDDVTPGAHPVAVISHQYWSRRFAKDPGVIGRRFRIGNDIFEIIGVAPQGFTGTDPGTFTDIFLPNMMNVPAIYGVYNGYRVWLRRQSETNLGEIRGRLSAALHASREEQVKTWPAERSKAEKDFFLAVPITLEPVGAGRSQIQHGYQKALAIFAVLVALVLLIACANVANLMTAQAAARAREMALRVAIGAGRIRLIQLVVIESVMIAFAASALGLALSAWAAPLLVRRLTPADQPVQLVLAPDWRVTLFALALTGVVAVLFGLAPAIRVSAIQPAITLKDGGGPRRHRGMMHCLVAAQVAFCCFVLFVSGLFILTFEKMANQPTGFSTQRLLTLEAISKNPLSATSWYQALQQVRSLPGVESASLAQYALMSFNAQTGFVWANGQTPDGTWSHSTWFLGIAPEWFETMGIKQWSGRDFRWDDEFPEVAIVNQTFARRYFGAESPLGRSFETLSTGGFSGSPGKNARVTIRIVGVVGDTRYEDMRLPIPAAAYVPFRRNAGNATGYRATFLVRTRTPDPMTLASLLRRAIPALQPELRIANMVPQERLVRDQMVRERLLATLALFFAAVALALSAIGLYGVLNYAVLERSRELGIRIALGAMRGHVVASVTFAASFMIALGAAIGLGLGHFTELYIIGMLYQVRAGDPRMMILPLIAILAVAALAALPPVFRAIHIDPAVLLRSE